MARSASTAMRSWPDSVSSSARAEPNRPKPMTNTGESECLTNDRPFSWITITGWPVSGSQTSGEADRPDTTDEHEGRQNPLTRLWGTGGEAIRSEEHTSELQSRFDLVCRLLLEKKKRYINLNNNITS